MRIEFLVAGVTIKTIDQWDFLGEDKTCMGVTMPWSCSYLRMLYCCFAPCNAIISDAGRGNVSCHIHLVDPDPCFSWLRILSLAGKLLWLPC